MPPWPLSSAQPVGGGIETPSPLSVSTMEVEVLRDPAEFVKDFSLNRALAVASLLDPVFTDKILGHCDRARFVPLGGGDNRLVEEPRLAGVAIGLALQRPTVLRWLELATGCGPLVSAYGSVLRVPGTGKSVLGWHDDLDKDPGRRLGLTIYLGGPAFAGGVFELREKTGTLLTRHRHKALGSAIIFEVAPDLEHRLSPIDSGGPRQVFTGWFTRAI
jgi:hypothetical protein